MNASKISAAKTNASALRIQLSQIRSQIPYASGTAQRQLVARAARVQNALAVASAR